MNKKNKIIFSLTALVLVLILGGSIYFYKQNFVSGVWRYKLTVVVETPEGIKTGYSVREVTNSASRIKFIDLPEATNPARGTGEAVVIDLGERGKLFALLSGYMRGPDHYKTILYKAFGGGTSFGGIRALNRVPIGQKVVLEVGDYPVLVAFKDISDPKTVTPVLEMVNVAKGYPLNYQIKKDHSEELFGAGVRIKEITIEMVNDSRTQGNIQKYLGNLHTVGPYPFVKGEKK